MPPLRLHFEQVLDPLSESKIKRIVEDHKGYVWVATDGGLNRYDGLGTKIFQHDSQDPHSLPDDRIRDLLIDSDNNLWVAAYMALARFDEGQQQFDAFRKPAGIDREELIDANCLLEGDDKNLWVGTQHGLYVFDKQQQALRQPEQDALKALSTYQIKSLQKVGPELWIGTDRGLFIYDPATKKVSPLQLADSHTLSASILDILASQQAEVWLATEKEGLLRLSQTPEPAKWQMRRFLTATQSTLSNKPIRRVFEDSQNRIWVGTENKGLLLYQPATESFFAYHKDLTESGALKSNSIWEIFEDRVGRMYLGSNNQGMFVHDPYAKWFNHKDGRFGQRLKFSTVSSFLEHEDQIWIGTDGGGISVWDRSSNQYSFLLHDPDDRHSLGSNEVLSLYKDSYGVIWTGNWKGGLNRYDPQSASFKRYFSHKSPNAIGSDNVFAIKEAPNGDLWMTTWDHGISRYNRATDDFFNIGYIPYNDTLLSHKMTYDLEIDDLTGDIWVATVLGLDRVRMLDDKRFKIKHYRLEEENPQSLSAHNVHCIYEDQQNRLWIGTSEGLNLFDRQTETFRRFYTRNGLSGNVIKEIIGDDLGNLWITTNKGITKMRESQTGFSFELYHKADGLQSDEFFFNSGLKTSSGELFLGGINGFNHFNPADFIPINHPPKLELTAFQLFYRDVKINDPESPLKADIGSLTHLELDKKQSVFSISYQGLCGTDPENIQYAYKLEGFDEYWNYVGKRSVATYTNLDAGEYTFLVRAANRDGLWMSNARELSITIKPPWWQSWWAGFLFLFAPIVFFLSLVQLRFAIIKTQKRQLAVRVDMQTESLRQQKEEIELQAEQLALANQQKNKLFSIISHDLRSPIYSLKGIVKLLDAGILKAEDLYRIKGDINRKIDNIGEVMENLLHWSVSQLEGEKVLRTDFDLSTICNEITNLYEPLAVEKEIRLLQGVKDPIMVHADPNQLRVILRNLLGNALKFTPTEGTVSLSADFRGPEMVKIIVSDTGLGMCPNQIKDLFCFTDKKSTKGTSGEKGVGLGLILVKEYVEKNGGKIEVESAPGVGTTFRFSLPLAAKASIA